MRRLLTRFAVMHARYRRFPFGFVRSDALQGWSRHISSRKVSVRVRVATWKPVISSGDIVWIWIGGAAQGNLPSRGPFVNAEALGE